MRKPLIINILRNCISNIQLAVWFLIDCYPRTPLSPNTRRISHASINPYIVLWVAFSFLSLSHWLPVASLEILLDRLNIYDPCCGLESVASVAAGLALTVKMSEGEPRRPSWLGGGVTIRRLSPSSLVKMSAAHSLKWNCEILVSNKHAYAFLFLYWGFCGIF